jgi:hypothetical protein
MLGIPVDSILGIVVWFGKMVVWLGIPITHIKVINDE